MYSSLKDSLMAQSIHLLSKFLLLSAGIRLHLPISFSNFLVVSPFFRCSWALCFKPNGKTCAASRWLWFPRSSESSLKKFITNLESVSTNAIYIIPVSMTLQRAAAMQAWTRDLTPEGRQSTVLSTRLTWPLKVSVHLAARCLLRLAFQSCLQLSRWCLSTSLCNSTDITPTTVLTGTSTQRHWESSLQRQCPYPPYWMLDIFQKSSRSTPSLRRGHLLLWRGIYFSSVDL